MAKKKSEAPEAPADQPAVPEATPVVEAPLRPTARSAVRWRRGSFPAAAGVSLEVSLWPHTIKLQDGTEIEVYNATVTRNYRDVNGQWCKGGSYRISELPVLIHALQKAHAFGLDAREQSCPI